MGRNTMLSSLSSTNIASQDHHFTTTKIGHQCKWARFIHFPQLPCGKTLVNKDSELENHLIFIGTTHQSSMAIFHVMFIYQRVCQSPGGSLENPPYLGFLCCCHLKQYSATSIFQFWPGVLLTKQSFFLFSGCDQFPCWNKNLTLFVPSGNLLHS